MGSPIARHVAPHLGGFCCRVASGADISRAIEIRRKVYVEEFGFALGGRDGSDSFDNNAYHLLVTKATDGQPVASLRLLDAPARPFEVESFVDIRAIVGPDRHLAEVSRLCVLLPYRRVSRQMFVHLSILEASLRLARELGVTDLIGWARQELLGFYKYILFEILDEYTFDHPKIGNRRHTLMRLDLTRLEELYKERRPGLYQFVKSHSPTVDSS